MTESNGWDWWRVEFDDRSSGWFDRIYGVLFFLFSFQIIFSLFYIPFETMTSHKKQNAIHIDDVHKSKRHSTCELCEMCSRRLRSVAVIAFCIEDISSATASHWMYRGEAVENEEQNLIIQPTATQSLSFFNVWSKSQNNVNVLRGHFRFCFTIYFSRTNIL